MKRIKSKLAIIAVFFMSLFSTSKDIMASPPQAFVSFQMFYDQLSPYGSWVNYPGYGYAWVPTAVRDFRPYYTGGHWVYSEMGWLWVSDFDWGWAPFHYGSWVMDPYYGWMWIPGYNWAPAWVVWGSYSDYYGWAPVGPGFSFSVSYSVPIDYWCFAQPHYMLGHDWYRHSYYAHDNRISITNNTYITNVNNITIINERNNYNNNGYYSGPRRENFERTANTTVRPVSISESPRPQRGTINNNTVNVYRPTISKDNNEARPSRSIQKGDRLPVNSSKQENVRDNQLQRPVKDQPKNDVRPSKPKSGEQVRPTGPVKQNDNTSRPNKGEQVRPTGPVKQNDNMSRPNKGEQVRPTGPVKQNDNLNRPNKGEQVQPTQPTRKPSKEIKMDQESRSPQPLGMPATQHGRGEQMQTQPMSRPDHRAPSTEPVRRPQQSTQQGQRHNEVQTPLNHPQKPVQENAGGRHR